MAKLDEETVKEITNKVQETIEQNEEVKKKIKSSGMLLTTIETIVIWFATYVLPTILLFVDKIKTVIGEDGEIISESLIGQNYCQFYESNYTGVLMIYTALTAVFLGKTLTKSIEHNENDIKKRKRFGKGLTAFVGLTIFFFWSILAPLLTNKIPYLTTYLNNINWATFWFIIIVGGIYVFNKLIIIKAFDSSNIDKIKEILKDDTE